MIRIRPAAIAILVSLNLAGCSVDNARNHYLLAEKLWTDKNYSAAVSEFEKVILKDPKGKLGLQATYRAAMTQSLFLNQYSEAIRKFRSFIQLSADPEAIWDAQLQIGEILFSKVDQYDQAIHHYTLLLKQKPTAHETPEILFRIAKSHFYLIQFDQAMATYREIIKRFPKSSLAEKALYELGVTYFTQGEKVGEAGGSDEEVFDEAIETFEKFIQKYPTSQYVPEAHFGIASCWEEMDQLERAYQAYQALKSTYPSPQVIEIKLARIRERLAQRKSSR